jgi:hypothetical protein
MSASIMCDQPQVVIHAVTDVVEAGRVDGHL